MPAPCSAPQVRGWLPGGALWAAGRGGGERPLLAVWLPAAGVLGAGFGGASSRRGRFRVPAPPPEESEPPGGRNAAVVLPSRSSEKPPPYEMREAGSFWALPEGQVAAGLNFIFFN